MKIRISRKNLSEYFILAMFTHPSLQEITDGDDLVIPADRYKDFLNDIGIIIGQLISYVARTDVSDMEE